MRIDVRVIQHSGLTGSVQRSEDGLQQQDIEVFVEHRLFHAGVVDVSLQRNSRESPEAGAQRGRAK